MKRVVMAGWLQRRGSTDIYGEKIVSAYAYFIQDGKRQRTFSRVRVDGEEYRRELAAANTRRLFEASPPDELTPKEGDTVRFRYTPNLHTVVSVTDNPQGPIAVLHRYDDHGLPLGGFAVRADDLRIVKRHTTR